MVPRCVSGDETLAIEMETTFLTLDDHDETIFGPVHKGDQFDFRGLIMYRLEDDRFAEIRVAYNSFTFTGVDGTKRELGIPH